MVQVQLCFVPGVGAGTGDGAGAGVGAGAEFENVTIDKIR